VLFFGFLSQVSLKRKTPQTRSHLPYLPWSNDALRPTGTQISCTQVSRDPVIDPIAVFFHQIVNRIDHFVIRAVVHEEVVDTVQLPLNP
jgi:hypothetical protein